MRLLPVSLTNRSPAVSNARPLGLHRMAALTAPRGSHSAEAKLPPWPNTRSATGSDASALLYSRTREFAASATYTLPAESVVTSAGWHKVEALGAAAPWLHLPAFRVAWPMTR